MALDYTRWPQTEDVINCLAAAALVLRDESGHRIPATTAAVTAEVARRTLRNFVADSVDETRTYDGTGTAEIEVDEIISLTGVQVTGLQLMPTYTLAGATIVKEQNKPQTRLVVAQGSVPAFTTEGVFAPYPLIFPAGRQNIQVTGRFGFGATVPADLWGAVLGEISHRLAAECIFNPAGRLRQWEQAGVTEVYALPDADATKWHGIYEATVGLYKRPAGRRLRNMRPRMI